MTPIEIKALLFRMFVYGCLGILVEFFFTGLHSLYKKHWKLVGHSYLWMAFPYSVAAIGFEYVRDNLAWEWYFKAFVYVFIIYAVEALTGMLVWGATTVLQRWLGGHGAGIPWDYPRSKITLYGLVQPGYCGYWLVLALAFHPVSIFLGKLSAFVGRMSWYT